jgi:hypothetical protein
MHSNIPKINIFAVVLVKDIMSRHPHDLLIYKKYFKIKYMQKVTMGCHDKIGCIMESVLLLHSSTYNKSTGNTAEI